MGKKTKVKDESLSTRYYKDVPEIFKEGDGRLYMEEIELIQKSVKKYQYAHDAANGFVAFSLFGMNEVQADCLVDKLNNLCERRNEKCVWFLGDKDEEYVYCF